ncbi:MAG TPA: hypothetical protein VIY73_26885, partial [Polyangiaceae bacterium]
MTEPRLSAATRALLRAAKTDAPGAAARAKVWSGVAASVGGAGAAGAAGIAAATGSSVAPGASAAAGGAAAATKLLTNGTLLGGTITVGLAAALIRVGPAPSPTPPAASIAGRAQVVVLDGPASPARNVPPPPVEHDDPPVPLASPPGALFPTAVTVMTGATGVTSAPRPRASSRPSSPANAPPTTSAADTFPREASLVAEAHAAMMRGDARSALRMVHAARALPSHALGPEELTLEAQALRILGRDDDARDAETR